MVCGSVLLLCFIGLALGRRRQTTSDFFLGGRRIPGWAVVLSFVATEVSAVTVIGVPATTYRENWQYMQFVVGSAAARVAVAFLFIPAFYRFNCTTIYEYLRHRFGALTQYTATLFFFITRLLASGVRLMAACLAVSVLLDWPIAPVIAVFSVVSILYIGAGGVRAVVWTNVVQALAILAAGAATVAFILSRVDGGLVEVVRMAEAAGRLDLWDSGPPLMGGEFLRGLLSDPNIAFVALLNGFFHSMAAFGTDHELMQRLLTVRTRRLSRDTLLWTIVASTAVCALYMGVGTCLFAYYGQHPELALPEGLDKIYPHFAAQVMSPALRGLVLTAIVMASIDSPLASLSASFVTDIYRPLIRKKADERHYVAVSRTSILAFGAALAAVAYAFSFQDRMLWLAFKIGGVTYGCLLGVFLLGLLTRRRADRANVVAMASMALMNAVLLVLSEKGLLPLGWSWLVILGTFGTIAVAAALGPWLDPEPA
jgi:SSS family transporter